MTTSARLLTILSLALPLAACAAQPAPAVQDAQAAGAAVPPSSAAPAPAQAARADRATPQSTSASAPPAPSTLPRRAAGAAAASPATPAATAPATQAATAAAPATNAPAANAPAVNPASPALPETTVGGGAAARPVPPAAPVTMPAGSATGSLLQTLFALIVVLAVLGALAWFLKRYGPKAMGGNAHLRIVGSLNLGGRERLLVVEVGNQWIVVGASPGRVNALATMPRQDGMETGAGADGAHATLAQGGTTAVQPAHSFADWLKQTLDKRK